jgi:hypothetical protein
MGKKPWGGANLIAAEEAGDGLAAGAHHLLVDRVVLSSEHRLAAFATFDGRSDTHTHTHTHHRTRTRTRTRGGADLAWCTIACWGWT